MQVVAGRETIMQDLLSNLLQYYEAILYLCVTLQQSVKIRAWCLATLRTDENCWYHDVTFGETVVGASSKDYLALAPYCENTASCLMVAIKEGADKGWCSGRTSLRTSGRPSRNLNRQAELRNPETLESKQFSSLRRALILSKSYAPEKLKQEQTCWTVTVSGILVAIAFFSGAEHDNMDSNYTADHLHNVFICANLLQYSFEKK